MAVYTRKIAPAVVGASDPSVISCKLELGAAAQTIKIPVPGRAFVAHVEMHERTLIGTNDCTCTFKNDAGTTLGTATAATSGSAIGDITAWTASYTNRADAIIDNGHFQITTTDTGSPTGTVEIYVVLESASGQY
jgi:hypothetical protein